jgi:hypothetical protein
MAPCIECLLYRLSFVLNAIYAEYHYDGCRYSECLYAECRGTVLATNNETSHLYVIQNKAFRGQL